MKFKEQYITHIVTDINDTLICGSSIRSVSCLWDYTGHNENSFSSYSNFDKNKNCILKSGQWINSWNEKEDEPKVQCQFIGNYKGNDYFVIVNVKLISPTIVTSMFEHCSITHVDFLHFLYRFQYNKITLCTSKFNNSHNTLLGANETIILNNSLNIQCFYLSQLSTDSLLIILPTFELNINRNINISVNNHFILANYLKPINDQWIYINSTQLFQQLKSSTAFLSIFLTKNIVHYILLINDKISYSKIDLFLIQKETTKQISIIEFVSTNSSYESDDGIIHIVISCSSKQCKSQLINQTSTIPYNTQSPSFIYSTQDNLSSNQVENKTDSMEILKRQPINETYSKINLSQAIGIVGSLIILIMLIIVVLKSIHYCCSKVSFKKHKSFLWIPNVKYGIPTSTGQLSTLWSSNLKQPLKRSYSDSDNIIEETNMDSNLFSNQSVALFKNNHYSYDISSSTPVNLGLISHDQNASDSNNCFVFFNSIPEKNLKLKHCIGYGAFGKVFLADLCYHNLQGISTSKEVAAKEMIIISPDDMVNKQNNLLKEISIMMKIGNHPYIISPIGSVKRKIDNTYLLIMEYCRHGDLKTYLTQLKTFDQFPLDTFLRFCQEIANGMEYLSNKNIIHRDLASRNVLISDSITCKISDFGLSRQLPIEESYYTNIHGVIPLKWMAPEVMLQNKYSTMADVWSFGVLLWEIYTRAQVPYENFTMNQVRDLINNGYRMPIPAICPDNVQQVIKDCWNFEACLRPKFVIIIERLKIGNT